MKLDIQFKELEILVSNMGASQVEWKSDVAIEFLESDWKIKLETTGIDVDINDIEILPNGLFNYRGEQILLYMKKAYFGYTYTFHFYDCEALKGKKTQGVFEKRYVVTQRKDGFFLMNRQLSNGQYDENKLEKLLACGHCLNWYNQKYPKKYGKHTKNNFNIAEFFEQFNYTPITDKPSNTDITAPAAGYNADWPHVSWKLRNRHNWICTDCGNKFESHQLDVHHINKIESDDRESNLKVVCKDCHAEYHQHMKRL